MILNLGLENILPDEINEFTLEDEINTIMSFNDVDIASMEIDVLINNTAQCLDSMETLELLKSNIEEFGCTEQILSFVNDNFKKQFNQDVSIEGVGSAISGAAKAIWEFIKKILKSLGEMFTKFFNGIKGYDKKLAVVEKELNKISVLNVAKMKGVSVKTFSIPAYESFAKGILGITSFITKTEEIMNARVEPMLAKGFGDKGYLDAGDIDELQSFFAVTGQVFYVSVDRNTAEVSIEKDGDINEYEIPLTNFDLNTIKIGVKGTRNTISAVLKSIDKKNKFTSKLSQPSLLTSSSNLQNRLVAVKVLNTMSVAMISLTKMMAVSIFRLSSAMVATQK